MLRLVRRHQKPKYDEAGKLIRGCPLKSETDRNCRRKVKCPIHLKGVGPDGVPVRETLRTRNWTVASEMLLERVEGQTENATSLTATLTDVRNPATEQEPAVASSSDSDQAESRTGT